MYHSNYSLHSDTAFCHFKAYSDQHQLILLFLSSPSQIPQLASQLMYLDFSFAEMSEDFEGRSVCVGRYVWTVREREERDEGRDEERFIDMC